MRDALPPGRDRGKDVYADRSGVFPDKFPNLRLVLVRDQDVQIPSLPVKFRQLLIEFEDYIVHFFPAQMIQKPLHADLLGEECGAALMLCGFLDDQPVLASFAHPHGGRSPKSHLPDEKAAQQAGQSPEPARTEREPGKHIARAHGELHRERPQGLAIQKANIGIAHLNSGNVAGEHFHPACFFGG